MSGCRSLVPQFQAALRAAKTKAEMLEAYFHFAAAHGAHQNLDPSTWEKLQSALPQQSESSD